jgi:hypothetical protein
MSELHFSPVQTDFEIVPLVLNLRVHDDDTHSSDEISSFKNL